jgi:hypothetical protein
MSRKSRVRLQFQVGIADYDMPLNRGAVSLTGPCTLDILTFGPGAAGPPMR